MVEVPPIPPDKRPVFYLPRSANIPKEWIIRRDLYSQVVVWPSRSIPEKTYELHVDLDNRKIACTCPGFHFRGRCQHIRALLFATYKALKKKGVQGTSIAAYHSFTPEELNARERAVFKALMDGGPATDRQLAARLHWGINCITPRRGALRDQGAVAEFGKIAGPEGRPETVWVAIDSLREEAS
jgi:hypothetical protein